MAPGTQRGASKDAIGGMTQAAYAQHLTNIDIINPGL